MRIALLVAASQLTLLAFAHPATADEARNAERIARLKQRSATPIAASVDTATEKLSRLRGRFPSASSDPVTAADEFIRSAADLLRVPRDLSGLQVSRRRDDRGGSTVVYEQFHEGVPVFEGSIVVGLGGDGSVIHVRNNFEPDLLLSVEPTLAPDTAKQFAADALGAFATELDDVRLVVVRGDREHPGHHLAWEVQGALDDPRGDWHVFVDAHSGEVVRTLDLMKSAGHACTPCVPANPGCGLVFHHHPVDALDDPALTDASNVDAAQTGCALANLTSMTELTGLWANTSLTSARVSPPYDFARSVNKEGADEVNVYYHVNRAKHYLDSLGFAGVMAFSIDINAHAAGDGASYFPSGPMIVFGDGGVDSASDADIVYHEYGHAIQDNQVPGFGTTFEGKAMGEGFGDYWAATLTDDIAATLLGTGCVAAWDATAYFPYDGSFGSGCLRRVDSTRTYPQNVVPFQYHLTGQIWSAALWDLRSNLGAATTDTLVVESHAFLTTDADFIDGADALLTADLALNSGINTPAIEYAMANRGIPRTGVPATGSTAGALAVLCETAHPYDADSYVECNYSVPGARRVRFHFSSFETEEGYDVVSISDGLYRQVQQLSGTPFGSGGSGYSTAVEGDTIVARMKADQVGPANGFTIDAVAYPLCPTIPFAGCSTAGKALLKLVGSADPTKRRFLWKWLKGTVNTADLSDPVAATDYATCVYEDGSLVAEVEAGSGAGWTARTGGFQYRSSVGNESGMSAAILKEGVGSAKLIVKAKSTNLALPTQPLEPASEVLVQMVKDSASGPECWESTFTPPYKKDTGTLFLGGTP